MIEILTITLPIFGAIALGFAAVRFGVFSGADMRVMGKYVLNIALPALLFSTMVKRDLHEVLNPGYAMAFLLGGVATIAVMLLWLSWQDLTPARRAIGVLGSSCPNSGYIGYPVMLLVFPDQAGVILALNFVIENLVLIPIGLILLELSRGQAHRSLPHMLGAVLYAVLKRPMMIGLMLGALCMVLDLSPPQSVMQLLEMLAASASALALFVIGGALVGLPIRGNRALAAQIVGGKLLLHPALVGLASLALPFLGLPALGPEMQAAVILSAAIPMFGVYTVLAQDYDVAGVASIAMLGATTGAFVSLTVLLALLT